MTIPVTLTVAASGATFFDDLLGKLSFSFKNERKAQPRSLFRFETPERPR